jgi:hypothetical protein
MVIFHSYVKLPEGRKNGDLSNIQWQYLMEISWEIAGRKIFLVSELL